MGSTSSGDVGKTRDRLVLPLDSDALAPPSSDVPGGYRLLPVRHPAAVREELCSVGRLAYRGSVDEVSEAEDRASITGTLDGAYGDFDRHASALALAPDGSIASTSLITHFHDRPLLADVFTHPEHRGRGLGTAVILASARALRAAGHTELVLVVTHGNPAAKLYERLGFVPWKLDAVRPPS